MQDHILVRYGELALKKSNRNQFVKRIVATIKRALSDFDKLEYKNCSMRFYIMLHGTNPDIIIPLLKKIPGIYSFSIVSRCNSNFEEIFSLSEELLKDCIAKGMTSFKVDTSRADKDFPCTSLDISRKVAGYLFKNIEGLKADMYNPDITLSLDVRKEGTFIFTDTIYGMGGMPSGSIGKVMLMVSGGIDSVVAGYLSIRKGMNVEAVHFSSPPYTSIQAVQKVIDLLEKLCPYTEYQSINLHIVPFTNIQKAIYDNCREDYGITIMRRMMYRITEGLAKKKSALAIVNGENIGQVASQTLESMQTIGCVTDMPVIRPLATFDKSDIIKISEEIGTYDISIRPYEDCCTVFVPVHPQIRPKTNIAKFEEEKFNYQELVEEAINNTERIILKSNKHYDAINESNEDDIF